MVPEGNANILRYPLLFYVLRQERNFLLIKSLIEICASGHFSQKLPDLHYGCLLRSIMMLPGGPLHARILQTKVISNPGKQCPLASQEMASQAGEMYRDHQDLI
jgi:hypothetical protein